MADEAFDAEFQVLKAKADSVRPKYQELTFRTS